MLQKCIFKSHQNLEKKSKLCQKVSLSRQHLHVISPKIVVVRLLSFIKYEHHPTLAAHFVYVHS